MDVYNEIEKLKENHLLSKHERIIQGVLSAVNNKLIKVGDKIPSVLKMAKTIGYSNRTVAVAYEELKDKGIIEAKSTKGYFLANEQTNTTLKLALVLYEFYSFQEDFYNILRAELGEKYHVDVFFHHGDMSMFKTISQNINGKYGFYIIAPIQNKEFMLLLNVFPENKTLLIDREPEGKQKQNFPVIAQEFEQATYRELSKIKDQVKKYNQIILFYNTDFNYPEGILLGFKKFVTEHEINHEVRSNYIEGSLTQGNLYFFIGDTPLWHFLRDVNKHSYILGNDIGVIAHNDSIEKEIILGGISTFSTNFSLMSIKSASHIKKVKQFDYEIIPSRLILRGSF